MLILTRKQRRNLCVIIAGVVLAPMMSSIWSTRTWITCEIIGGWPEMISVYGGYISWARLTEVFNPSGLSGGGTGSIEQWLRWLIDLDIQPVGLVANVILSLAWVALAVQIYRRYVRRITLRHNCNECGHDLRFIPSERCPECGTPRRRPNQPDRASSTPQAVALDAAPDDAHRGRLPGKLFPRRISHGRIISGIVAILLFAGLMGWWDWQGSRHATLQRVSSRLGSCMPNGHYQIAETSKRRGLVRVVVIATDAPGRALRCRVEIRSGTPQCPWSGVDNGVWIDGIEQPLKRGDNVFFVSDTHKATRIELSPVERRWLKDAMEDRFVEDRDRKVQMFLEKVIYPRLPNTKGAPPAVVPTTAPRSTSTMNPA